MDLVISISDLHIKVTNCTETQVQKLSTQSNDTITSALPSTKRGNEETNIVLDNDKTTKQCWKVVAVHLAHTLGRYMYTYRST
jgi:hypothetical protein